MTTAEFLAKLSELDIRLARKGDKLSVNAPDGAMTAEIRAEIGARKEEILALLGASTDFELISSPDSNEGPLSFAQQRLWFLYKFNPEDVSYNLAVSTFLPESLGIDDLQNRISTIVENNHSLRTIFPERDGIPYQKVVDGVSSIKIRDVDAASDDHDRLRDIQYEIMRRPFNLETEVPVRFELLKLRDGARVLLVPIHHIVSDAWSLGLLMKQLLSNEQNAPKFQYLDFAFSEQQWFQSRDQTDNIEYWKSVIKAPVPVLELPTKTGSKHTSKVIGDSYSFTLSKEVSTRLRNTARQNQLTLYSVLLGIYKVILHRYSGQNDILVGSPVTSRSNVELEDMIGIFINTLVVRSKFDSSSSFKDVAKQIHNSMLEALEHRDFPFEKVVELARQEKIPNSASLFKTAFILNNTPNGGNHQDFAGGSIFDISLYVEDSADGISGTIEYNTALFDRSTIERLASHYDTLADSVSAGFDRSVSSLQLVSADELSQMDSWNATERDYPKDVTTSQIIEKQAADHPERVAIVSSSKTLTYGELNTRANKLARKLLEIGVTPGSLVGICLDRDAEMIIAALAIWKTGAAYVPLDPTYPIDRLSYMGEDARLKAIVSETQFNSIAKKIAEAPAAHIILIDSDPDSDAKVNSDDLSLTSSSRDVAYVIYTSGSTGKPKGVLIEHRSLINLLYSIKERPGFTENDVLFSVTTLSFDIAGLELYLPLISSAKVVISSRKTLADPRALADEIRSAGTTVVQATPAMWRFLLDAGWTDGKGLKILCGGEALPRTLADEILNTGAELWNVYGPTETTIWSTATQVLKTDRTVSIGSPLANTQVYVLDEQLNRVPLNIPGELYIGGDGVARGYLNRPELTEERFVRNVFVAADDLNSKDEHSERMYRTGDQVRLNSEGLLEYIGRLDNQVKVRGYRIELGEIEAVLAKHESVQQVVVVAREDTPGDQKLVAYIISRYEKQPDSSTYRSYLSQLLPPFMIPAAFVHLSTFPLTPNAKVDRKALPAPESSARSQKSSKGKSGAGETELERKLIQIWEKVLGVKNIGRNDNFFELGGNSLLGIRLLSGIERALNIHVPVAVIFQGQTVASMASRLEDTTQIDPHLRAVALQSNGHLPPLFFVPGVNGNVIGYEDLATGLGTERPLYGLRSVGLEGEAEPVNDLSEIARHFVADVKKVQPQGPYHFMGFCVGGMVAFEMAQQLKAEGEQIEFLGLIDTWPQEMVPTPKAYSGTGQQLHYLSEAIKRNMREFASVPMGRKLDYIKQKLGAATDMATKLDVYRGDDGERLQDLVITSNQIASSTYVASSYDGPLSLYITLGDLKTPSAGDPRLYWKSFGNEQTSVKWIPGIDSGSLLKKPYLSGLLKALKTTLEKGNEN